MFLKDQKKIFTIKIKERSIINSAIKQNLIQKQKNINISGKYSLNKMKPFKFNTIENFLTMRYSNLN